MKVLRFPIESTLQATLQKSPLRDSYDQVFQMAHQVSALVLNHLLRSDIPIFMIGWQTLYDRDKGRSMDVGEGSLEDHPYVHQLFARVRSYHVEEWLRRLNTDEGTRDQFLTEVANRYVCEWFGTPPSESDVEKSLAELQRQLEQIEATSKRWNFVFFNRLGLLFIEVFVIENLIER